jgi:hypothetical protein
VSVVVTSLLQYLVALGALGNILHATYWVGIRTVVIWDCRSSYWPLLWVLLSTTIHLMAVLSLRTAIHRKKSSSTSTVFDGSNRSLDKTPSANPGGGLSEILRNEITPSANSKWQVSDLYDLKIGILPVVLQYTGAFTAVCHLVFGTLLFSSLIFVEVGNAVVLILRLIASATACRMILQFEVGGMIKVDERRVYRWIVQPVKED